MLKVLAASFAFVFAGAGVVRAADLPSAAPAPAPYVAPVAAFSWNGCYAGLEGGWNGGKSNQYSADVAANGPFVGLPESNRISLNGALAGGEIGCNYQFGHFVLGSETDFSWSSAKGSQGEIVPFNLQATLSTKEKWLETSRARVGYAWDRLLVYATGGGAIADLSFSNCNAIVAGCVSASQTVVGYSVGGGIEYAIWNNVSLKLEYIHTDFGKTPFQRVYAENGHYSSERKISLSDDIVRAGINYKFW